MIPLRVKMAGFLSYKGEQEIDFGNANLWMLAGTNGSGKSSVFDALTYALFGSHRGGSTNAVELINKESPGANVEFDFRLESQAFRAKRTVRRTNKGASSATQQIFREVAPGTWEAVPDTTKKVDFDKWIADKIGLTYEVFTSSVLLLQNKAERLLDARASDRAEVLASIVDLERYQKLHARANEYKLEYKNRLEAVSHRASGVPDVSDMEYMAAVLEIEAKEDDRKVCQGEIESLLNLEVQCRRWLEAQSRVTAAAAKLQTAEALLTDAVQIEAAYRRYAELRAVLPAVSVVLSMKADARQSQTRTERFERQRGETQENKRQTDAELAKVKADRDAAARQLAADEAELATVNARLRELAGALERVRQVEAQQAELTRHEAELQRQPADPEATLTAAQREADRLAEVAGVLPVLVRVNGDRHELAEALKADARDGAELRTLEADGKRLGAEAKALAGELISARQVRAATEQRAGVAAALADRAKAAVAQFESLTGAKDCPACGQELTPKHLDAERTRRRAEADAAAKDRAAADRALTDATAAEAKLAEQDRAAQKTLADLRERYAGLKAEVKGHRDAVRRLTDSLTLRHAELPAALQSKVAPETPADAVEWAATKFPERDELAALTKDAKALPRGPGRARQGPRGADALRQAARAGRRRARRPRQVAAGSPRHGPRRLTLGTPDPRGPRKVAGERGQGGETVGRRPRHADRHAHRRVAPVRANPHRPRRQARQRTQRPQERGRQRRPGQARAAAPTGSSASTPPGWARTAAGRPKPSGSKPTASRRKFKGLASARAGLENLRDALRDAGSRGRWLPAREPPRPGRGPRRASPKPRPSSRPRSRPTSPRLQQRGKLDDYRTQRDALGTETRQLDAKFTRYKTLSELLGRDRLQRYLVRRAERQIVDYANGVSGPAQRRAALPQARRRRGDRGRQGARTGGVQPHHRRVADPRRIPLRQPEVPRRGLSRPRHRAVRQPAAPADRERHHRRGLRLPRPPGPAGDDPGTPEPPRAPALHFAGEPPGGVRRRLPRRLPLRVARRRDAGQPVSALNGLLPWWRCSSSRMVVAGHLARRGAGASSGG